MFHRQPHRFQLICEAVILQGSASYGDPSCFGWLLLSVPSGVVLGSVVTRRIRDKWHEQVDTEFPSEAAKRAHEEPTGTWLVGWLGALEIATYLILIAFGGIGAAAFIIGWIALKMATGWHRYQQSLYNLRLGLVALALNLINILIAIAATSVFFGSAATRDSTAALVNGGVLL